MTLYLATENAGKIREMTQILRAALPQADIRSMTDLDAAQRARYVADETGTTYAANALIKAQALARIVEGIIVADDSGFEVDQLGGAPGVYSARYAGDDRSRCEKILRALEGKTGEARRARFIACMAVLENGKNPVFLFGRKEGYVASAISGTNGFGYDPIFCPDQSGPTWGELGAEEKNADSHRRRALDLMIRFLLGVEKGDTQYPL